MKYANILKGSVAAMMIFTFGEATAVYMPGSGPKIQVCADQRSNYCKGTNGQADTGIVYTGTTRNCPVGYNCAFH